MQRSTLNIQQKKGKLPDCRGLSSVLVRDDPRCGQVLLVQAVSKLGCCGGVQISEKVQAGFLFDAGGCGAELRPFFANSFVVVNAGNEY
jgi:hypothetical protein